MSNKHSTFYGQAEPRVPFVSAWISKKDAMHQVAQIAVLLALAKAGSMLATLLQVPLPGSMLGMVLLFVLLCLRVVRLEWIEAGASLLLKHLAFFFVPIAVGLMGLGDVWRSSGLALLLILVVSAAAGILFAGLVTHLLAPRQRTDLRRTAKRPAGGVTP